MSNITAIYPGSFDPVTLGHLDVLARCCKLFDNIVMAVVGNPGKKPLFETAERIELIKKSIQAGKDTYPELATANIKVSAFNGLLVNFARTEGATVIVRGLRAISDFEYEFKMSQMNKTLYPEVETVFVMSSKEYTFLSSSMVKEVVMLGGDIASLVPEPVSEALKNFTPGA